MERTRGTAVPRRAFIERASVRQLTDHLATRMQLRISVLAINGIGVTLRTRKIECDSRTTPHHFSARLGAKPKRLAGIAQANRELVAYEFTATTGEGRRTAGETCPLLLTVVSGKPPNKTIVWQSALADHSVAASGGMAEAAGTAKSIQSQKGTESCLTKPDGEVVVRIFGTRVGPDGTLYRALGQAKEKVMRWNPSLGI